MNDIPTLKKRVLEFLIPIGTEITAIVTGREPEDHIVFLRGVPLSVNILRDIIVMNYLDVELSNITDEQLEKTLFDIIDNHIYEKDDIFEPDFSYNIKSNR
jgi:hypothetical protein